MIEHPQLTLDNAAQAIDWYKKALGAEELSRFSDDEGRCCTRCSHRRFQHHGERRHRGQGTEGPSAQNSDLVGDCDGHILTNPHLSPATNLDERA
jgi:hypothetical protein